eukprot:4411129-Pyramimonas_sp.AAC.1
MRSALRRRRGARARGIARSCRAEARSSSTACPSRAPPGLASSPTRWSACPTRALGSWFSTTTASELPSTPTTRRASRSWPRTRS